MLAAGAFVLVAGLSAFAAGLLAAFALLAGALVALPFEAGALVALPFEAVLFVLVVVVALAGLFAGALLAVFVFGASLPPQADKAKATVATVDNVNTLSFIFLVYTSQRVLNLVWTKFHNVVQTSWRY